ncbi:hypothetical protein ACVCNR_05740 [Aquamicrobium terrae]
MFKRIILALGIFIVAIGTANAASPEIEKWRASIKSELQHFIRKNEYRFHEVTNGRYQSVLVHMTIDKNGNGTATKIRNKNATKQATYLVNDVFKNPIKLSKTPLQKDMRIVFPVNIPAYIRK